MAALRNNRRREAGARYIVSGQSIENPWIDRDLLVRRLSLWRKAFPFDWRERIQKQRFEDSLVNAFAVPAVRHDDDAVFGLVEDNHVVPESVVVSFFKTALP